MAKPEHLNILNEGVDIWNAWIEEHPEVKPDLKGAELPGAMLDNVKLIRGNLKQAFLQQVRMRFANLYRVNLVRADLKKAKLQETNLKKANLTGADLRKANLKNCNLRESNLSESKLKKTKLDKADLRDADLKNSDLSSASLRHTNLSHVKLRNANLNNTSLWDADFRSADARNVNLSKADLKTANFSGANLSGADMRDANFSDEKGKSVILKGANLRDAKFTDHPTNKPHAGFLELASVDDLDTVDFGNPKILVNYLTNAFEYANRPDLVEREAFPEFYNKALNNIKLLRSILSPIHIPGDIIELKGINDQLIRRLKAHPEELPHIHPRQFKELIAEILSSFDWEVELTSETEDHKYDIFAICKNKAGVNHHYIIECKKNYPENKVDIDVVSSLYGLGLDLNIGNVMLATTGKFTDAAQHYNTSRYNLYLKDYTDIIDWINAYKPNPRGRLYIDEGNALTLPKVSHYSCFISYSNPDYNFAKMLHATMENAGVKCWFAAEDMKIGDRIRDTIDDAIRLRQKLLVILSNASINSTWVEKEVETAFEKEQQNKTVILFPIRIDDAVLNTNKSWAADIRRTRHIGDFTQWNDANGFNNAFNRLIRDLKV